ncbi:hypothetical protein SAMN05216526_0953 [Ectothiorhodosinus mongolicus]|uniref:Lipoprotein n=1 Tax=Ectothiorhodosinus mongolicus TaxID=233100 RepID=A0A1R3VV37_9GAMM|nr:hypothetical protein [Ectothiorhodosinus mongolicus]ULX56897.1 hypothetical protein CKX93_03775 [Ectothiorhodosinus mongolicus]SIT68871.1 hypothetical protein SAMN05216526_0953 [Ectothiorhodosinus mongolicus]
MGALKALIVLLGLLLSGCASLTPVSQDGPPEPDWQTDAAACHWVWQENDLLGLWSEVCELNTGRWELEWDETQQAFLMLHDGVAQDIVVQVFFLHEPLGLAGLPTRLVAAGYLNNATDCALTPIALRPAPRTMMFYQFMPCDPQAFAPTEDGQVPEPQCGPYGASTHGVRYFITDLRWPDRAIYVDEGQERFLFDARTITPIR